jgi:hypothetical protein
MKIIHLSPKGNKISPGKARHIATYVFRGSCIHVICQLYLIVQLRQQIYYKTTNRMALRSGQHGGKQHLRDYKHIHILLSVRFAMEKN